MNFEDLKETTKLRLKNNGINSDEDLINHLLDEIESLKEFTQKDNEMKSWRIMKNEHNRVGADNGV